MAAELERLECSHQPDPNTNNNVVTKSVEVLPPPPPTDLSLTATATNSVLVGQGFIKIITVTNPSANVAVGVVAKDILPFGSQLDFAVGPTGPLQLSTANEKFIK